MTTSVFCCCGATHSHALRFQLRVEPRTRNPDYAATACQCYSTHLWHRTSAACPPSISPPSGRNPNKPASSHRRFHPSPSLYYIESTARKSDTFPAVVSVKQESAPGQVNQSTLVMWLIFRFGMCWHIAVAVARPVRKYARMHPSCTPPSMDFYSRAHQPGSSGVGAGSESPLLASGANCVVARF